MLTDHRPVTAIVMAKHPVPGTVKTRYMSESGVGPEIAADLAWAMLECVVRRLERLGPVVLAASPDDSGPLIARRLGIPGLSTLDQGAGTLGERIDRVWRSIGDDLPVAFFGSDSPDVPRSVLRQIRPAIDRSDVAIGPTPDGGYWTLASSRYRPALLREIDWGSEHVYDQTLHRAGEAGFTVHRLPEWPDVDRPADVDTLRSRLDALAATRSSDESVDAELDSLGERLNELLSIRRHGEPR